MNNKMHPAIIMLIVTAIVYTVVISGFAFTNNTKTNRNEQDIHEIRQEQKEFAKAIYQELKEINSKL